jgi:dTDP-4-amino-4,6-dideoxygalactose transaminase
MQAAFLRVKLAVLDGWNARRREIADQYSGLLGASDIVLPFVPDYVEPVWHLYVIRSRRRAALQTQLGERGISTVIHYPIPPHRQGCYPSFVDQPLPVAELLAEEVLSLPMSPAMVREEIEYVAQSIEDFGA